MNASVAARPAHFDRVDRVKVATRRLPEPGDDRLWILGGNLTFTVDGRVHCVPIGFVTNGTSIPRVGRLLTGHWWTDERRWPVVCHDWLCSHPMAAKSYADAALRALLHAEGVPWWRREIMYFSTRWFGVRAWRTRAVRGPVIYDKGALMDDLPDYAPTLESAATRSQFFTTPVWSTTRPADRHEDVVRFEATGANYADLRQSATDMLAALLGEATVEGRVRMNLEIEPDINEMGSETPVAWRAAVVATIPSR
jgi:hypothetical protein